MSTQRGPQPRVAIAGAGAIARFAHLPSFLACETRIVGVADAVLDRARKLADLAHCAAFDDAEKMITTEAPDIVVVATPNSSHMEVATLALRHGAHVFCEKPLGRTAAEASEIVNEATSRRLAIGVNHHLRFSAETEAIRRAIEDGRLGRLSYVWFRNFRRQGIPGLGGWFTSQEESGGGALLDIGSHGLDWISYVTGQTEAVVTGHSSRADHGPRGRGAGGWGVDRGAGVFDVEDLSLLDIRFTDGTEARIESAWAVHAGNEFRIQVVGDLGGIDFNPDHGDARLRWFDDTSTGDLDLPALRDASGRLAYGRLSAAVGETALTEPTALPALYQLSTEAFLRAVAGCPSRSADGLSAVSLLQTIDTAYALAQAPLGLE